MVRARARARARVISNADSPFLSPSVFILSSFLSALPIPPSRGDERRERLVVVFFPILTPRGREEGVLTLTPSSLPSPLPSSSSSP